MSLMRLECLVKVNTLVSYCAQTLVSTKSVEFKHWQAKKFLHYIPKCSFIYINYYIYINVLAFFIYK